MSQLYYDEKRRIVPQLQSILHDIDEALDAGVKHRYEMQADIQLIMNHLGLKKGLIPKPPGKDCPLGD